MPRPENNYFLSQNGARLAGATSSEEQPDAPAARRRELQRPRPCRPPVGEHGALSSGEAGEKLLALLRAERAERRWSYRFRHAPSHFTMSKTMSVSPWRSVITR